LQDFFKKTLEIKKQILKGMGEEKVICVLLFVFWGVFFWVVGGGGGGGCI